MGYGHSSKRWVSLVCVVLATLTLTGCKNKKVSFHRSVVPPQPNVLPESQRFKLAFAVTNPTSDPIPLHKLKVKVEAWYNSDFTPEPQYNEFEIPLPYIEGDGGKIIQQSIEFDKNEYAGDPRRCMQNNCEGTLVISLLTAGGNLKPGPNTKLQITWKKSGSLQEMTVVDLSD